MKCHGCKQEFESDGHAFCPKCLAKTELGITREVEVDREEPWKSECLFRNEEGECEYPEVDWRDLVDCCVSPVWDQLDATLCPLRKGSVLVRLESR
jgi:hypothetical protein